MLQSLNYLSQAICQAPGGRRGEELLHSTGVGVARHGGVGQRRWCDYVADRHVGHRLPGRGEEKGREELNAGGKCSWEMV